jgi:hypothetical protein
MMVVFEAHSWESIMDAFLQRHRDQILGVLSGCDRVLFRGTLRSISYLDGMERLLASYRIPYQQFAAFAERVSGRLKQHAQQLAEKHRRPFVYLASAADSKEDYARSIVERDGIRNGLVCVLSCVEPCQTYALKKDAKKKHLLLVPAQRKCLYLYFYFVDREFGLIHVRLQTWLPMSIQICVNGREYLARRLDRAKIGYEKRDNCFARIDNLPRAQQMMDELDRRRWAKFLNHYARLVNPWVIPGNSLKLFGYYWTVRQSEYATDVMFKDKAALQAIYPKLVAHAITQLTCEDVLRFLGRRIDRRFAGEVTSDVVKRIEGVRVKHRVEENSLKMYDKQGSVLRIETTVNDPRRFKVRRLVTRKGQTGRHWVAMRKGLADIERRVDICRAANERYLEALAVVGQAQPVAALLDPVSRRVQQDGRPYRPLRPLTREETDLFRVVLRGEFLLQGFRNPDLRRALLPEAERDPCRRRQASARITRLLRLLRAHGLIRKVPSTRYYRVTVKGQQVMPLALQLRETDLARLAA